MSKRLLLITAAATWLTAVLPVEAVEPTKPSATVDIQASSDVGTPCFGFGFVFDREVVKSGGTVVPFSIPDGKVLVVTGLDWGVQGNVTNKARTASLLRFNGGVNGPSAQSTALADAFGTAGASVTFPTGIVLNRPGVFCIQLTDSNNFDHLTAVVHGFLANDK